MQINRVLRNTFSLFTGKAASHALTAIFNIYLTRALGKEFYGDFTGALSWIVMFSIVAEYGLGTLMTRIVAREPERSDELFWNSVILKTFCSILAVALAIGALVLRDLLGFGAGGEDLTLIALFCLFLFANAWYMSMAAILRGHQDNHLEAALFLIGKVLYVALGFGTLCFAKCGLDVKTRLMAVYFALGAFVPLVLGTIALRLRYKLGLPKPSLKVIMEMLTQGWQFFTIMFTSTLHLKFDHVLLWWFGFKAQLGVYGAAYNLVLIPLFLTNSFTESMYPALASSKEAGEEDFWQRVMISLRWIGCLGFPFLFWATLEAPRILDLVYGKEFVEGALALQILIWGQGLDLFCPFFGHVLYVKEKERKVFFINLASLIGNILSNVILIYFLCLRRDNDPTLAPIASALSMVVSLSIMFIGYVISFAEFGRAKASLLALAKPAILAIITLPVVFLIKPYVPVYLTWLVYGIVFISLALALKIIRLQDYKRF